MSAITFNFIYMHTYAGSNKRKPLHITYAGSVNRGVVFYTIEVFKEVKIAI